MNKWGLSKGGALVALLLIVSGAFVLPTAHAQGETFWGVVWTDCGLPAQRLVSADVTLVDAHAQVPDETRRADTGFFEFQPMPGSYFLKAKPDGFGAFTNETGPYRFDGTAPLRRDVCVDDMPDKTLALNLTILDAQPGAAVGEAVTFAETTHGPPSENVTLTWTPANYTVRFANRPLVDGSETGRVVWFNNTGFTPVSGNRLVRGAHFDYSSAEAFTGYVTILDAQMRIEIENSYFGRSPLTNPVGWLHVEQYRSASTASSLAHGQVANEQFFKNGVPMPGYSATTLTLDRATGDVEIFGNWTFGVDDLTASYVWSGAISGAEATIRDTVHRQAISDALTTNSAGKAFGQLWANTFDLKVEATGYRPIVQPLTVTGDTTLTVYMTRTLEVTVIATDTRGRAVKDGLVAVLINTNTAVDEDIRILKGAAPANSNVVRVPAYTGVWDLIVDAKGFTAVRVQDYAIGAFNRTYVATLAPSPEERIETSVLIDNTNWSLLTVYRKVTLLRDSEWPGIGYTGLRDRDWQLSLKFGDKDRDFEAFEDTAFEQYLRNAGAFYTVTEKFVTVNGNWYRSNNATLVVNVTTAGTNVTVWTSVQYSLASQFTSIPANKARYFVNVTTVADKNVTHYQNQTFFVRVPSAYELTSKTVTGRVVTRGFVSIEVDPEVDAVVPNPRANLIIDRSLTGVARAEVEGPIGKVYVKNADQDKYLAWVSNNTKVVFSANKTTDRQNQAVNAKDAKFNWTFRYAILNTSVKGWAEGIWTTFDFGSLGTDYTVNLTVTQVNPQNVTYRQFNLTVDNLNPNASFSTNRTTGDNPASLTVKEDLLTRFDGTKSSDLMWGATLKGEIAEWNWDFDHDGTVDRTGRVVTYNYSTPGSFFLNLSVVDRVGHKSLNQTLPVTVQDVSPPVVNLVILDENNSWREITQLTEGKGYWFNVSGTTDNSLENPQDAQNLSYRFDWGQGAANVQGPMPGTSFNLNLTHVYADHGEYKLSINVTDAAANHGYLNRTLVVQANTTDHPDLTIIAGTLKISPTSPEEGQATTFRLNLTNAKDKVNATDLQLNFSTIEKGRDVKQAVTGLRWLNPDGSTATRVEPGKNVTVEFKWTPPTLGNKSLRIKVWDGDEPTAWVTNANEVTTNLVVKEAGYKIWLWVGGFLFVIVGLPLIYYIVRKVRAGELGLPRRRKAEDADEDEDEEPEDDDEEGGGGKKRL